MLSDPVSWLDVIVLLAAYLVASGLHKLVTGLLAARDRYDELTETGGEAAPDRPDDESADPTRAVCYDPAASPPQPLCSGACLTGDDLGVPTSAIAYPHPDCPLHGDSWMPYDNEWSRRYVAAHPERFAPRDGDD